MHFVERGNNVMVIVNQHAKEHDDSAVILENLNLDQTSTYRSLKEAGLPEPLILKKIFPELRENSGTKSKRDSYASYSKSKLASLIRDEFSAPLPSLLRMTKSDLCVLCARLELQV